MNTSCHTVETMTFSGSESKDVLYVCSRLLWAIYPEFITQAQQIAQRVRLGLLQPNYTEVQIVV